MKPMLLLRICSRMSAADVEVTAIVHKRAWHVHIVMVAWTASRLQLEQQMKLQILDSDYRSIGRH